MVLIQDIYLWVFFNKIYLILNYFSQRIWAQLTESFVLSLFKVGIPSLEAEMQQFDRNRKFNPRLDRALKSRM